LKEATQAVKDEISNFHKKAPPNEDRDIDIAANEEQTRD
jgi:hypothetical protein